MRRVLRMSASGSAASSTTSAALPGSIEPTTSATPSERAGSMVAAPMAPSGGTPASTNRRSSSCSAKPGTTLGSPESVPVSSRTPVLAARAVSGPNSARISASKASTGSLPRHRSSSAGGVSATPSRAATASQSRVRPRQETSVGVNQTPALAIAGRMLSASDSGAQNAASRASAASERMRARTRAEQGSMPRPCSMVRCPAAIATMAGNSPVAWPAKNSLSARLCSTIAS